MDWATFDPARPWLKHYPRGRGGSVMVCEQCHVAQSFDDDIAAGLRTHGPAEQFLLNGAGPDIRDFTERHGEPEMSRHKAHDRMERDRP